MAESAAPATDTQRGTRALASIQVLRAVAALAVLLHHILNELTNRFALHFPLDNFLIGAAGVDLFFVISGFVMVHASQSMFGRPGAARIFLLRRLARIVPLYWAVTALFVGYLFVAHRIFPPPDFSLTGVIASFAFVPYPRLSGYVAPVHVLGWTLNDEMFFYLLFGAAIMLSLRQAVSAITALFVALVALGMLFALPQPFASWFDPIILEFCLGMWIAVLYRAGVRLSHGGRVAFTVAAIAGYVLSALFAKPEWRVLAWGMPSAVLVAGGVLSSAAASARNPVTAAFAFLGDASYSLYLIHIVAFLVVYRVLVIALGQPPMPWLYALALFTVSLACAVLSYRLFERPITRLLQRCIGRLTPAQGWMDPDRATTATPR